MGRVLVVTKWLPLPANDGGKQRSLAVVRALAARADVVVCGFDDGTADYAALAAMGVEARGVPRPVGVARLAAGTVRTGSIGSGRFASPQLRRVVQQSAAPGLDALVIEYLQMVPYAAGVAARRRVLDLHNIESTIAARYAEVHGGLRRHPARIESWLLRRQERRALHRFDAVAVVSATDAAQLPGAGAGALICPNGCDDRPVLDPPGRHQAAFVGLMGWTPNADAAVWLAREVWPKVRGALPDAVVHLVGRDPGPEVRDLHGAGVEVTGTVPEVAPYLEASTLALAPLRIGGGSRLKILEALAYGRPVVATPVGAEGLEDLIGEGVVVAAGPDEMATAIVRLLRDPEEAARLGDIGRRAVHDRYRWEVVLSPLVGATLD